ncbi:MAG TPA: threonine dehydratase [Solimonas sp.]|nr:threonine dehydratase [Solimonas sp.]
MDSIATFDREGLLHAAELVYRHMPPTPQREWPLLSRRLGVETWVKHENHAPTGAFKLRGGLVYMERLRRERPQVAGVISATRGNHGLSLACAGRAHGVRVTICVPRGNSAEKNAAMQAYGAELVEHGDDFDEARLHAAQLADEQGLELVPSFHPDLVLGVATLAWEFLHGAPPLDTVYVGIGMGSGICAMIAVRDLLGLPTEIVGVQAAGAPSYQLSFAAGRVVPTARADTLADGLATRSPDPRAVDIIRRGAARVLLVSDGEVAEAIRIYHTDTHNLSEGAGAAALAAALQERGGGARRIGLVLSGGNIDLALLRSWVLPEA